MVLRAIDLETTGIPNETDRHAVCEIGWCDVELGSGGRAIKVGMPHSELVNPGREIPPEARAVHHISNQDVAGKRSPDQVFSNLGLGVDYFAAHQADFERQFYPADEKPWICTYKCALRVWPDAPKHTNQVLRYFLGFDLSDLAMPPHRAGPDAYVTAALLAKLIERAPLDDLLRWSSGPALLVRVGFGKHFGMRWAEVPKDYLHWIVNTSGISDRDVRATARYYLRENA